MTEEDTDEMIKMKIVIDGRVLHHSVTNDLLEQIAGDDLEEQRKMLLSSLEQMANTITIDWREGRESTSV